MDKNVDPEPEELRSDACIVYDRATGEILHTHEVITLPGAHPPDEKELAAEALALASEGSGKKAQGLDILRVDRQRMKVQRGLRYKVDVKRRHLIEERTDKSE